MNARSVLSLLLIIAFLTGCAPQHALLFGDGYLLPAHFSRQPASLSSQRACDELAEVKERRGCDCDTTACAQACR